MLVFAVVVVVVAGGVVEVAVGMVGDGGETGSGGCVRDAVVVVVDVCA